MQTHPGIINNKDIFRYMHSHFAEQHRPVDTHKYLPHHQPPAEYVAGDCDIWALTGGRGSGKTYSAAIEYDSVMRAIPGTKGRIIAPTVGEAIQSCVTGTSGLLTLYPDVKLTTVASTKIVRWPNGSEAAILGVWTKRDIAKMRAVSNRTIDWFEEFTHLRMMQETFEEAALGRRIGQPRALITTTPTAHPYWAKVVDLPNVAKTHGTMFDNPHLSEEYKSRILDLFKDTSLEGQEIWGLILTDVDGALWTSENLNAHRFGFGQFAKLSTVLRTVGVDPAVESGTTGIVAAGSFRVGDVWHIACLEDVSVTDAEPHEWARGALTLAVDWDCQTISAERNQGGRMVKSTIEVARQQLMSEAETPEQRSQLAQIRVELVHARDGKHTRAQPVALLHEQGRGHMVGRHELLENQLSTWVPGDESPDRLDAYVWAATGLINRFRTGRSGVASLGTYK